MNHDPNGVHYHQTPPALAANPHYYDAHASTASNHAGVQNSFHGKQSQKTYDESEKSRTTIASKVTEADPWLGPDLSHAPWVPVIKQDEVESISDFTYQNFVDCWAMRDKRTYPSIWEIKSCQVKDSGATEGYEIKASWGIIQPMGLWYPKAHPQNVMVLRILQEMKALCGTGKDAFLKEYKWEDVKDAPVWRKHVKEWIFFGDTFHGILRRYKVSASCTEDCKSHGKIDLTGFANIASMGLGRKASSSVERCANMEDSSQISDWRMVRRCWGICPRRVGRVGR
jgi:hypothetical protein